MLKKTNTVFLTCAIISYLILGVLCMGTDDINEKIRQLKKDLKEVKGREPERYSRICGYFRPINAFNPGKVEEVKQRKYYKLT